VKNRFQKLPFKCNVHRYNEEGAGAEPSTAVRRSKEALREYRRRVHEEESTKKQKTAAPAPPAKKLPAPAVNYTTSGCLVVAFAGSRDGELSVAPAVTRGGSPGAR
jgi:hypothetical protein